MVKKEVAYEREFISRKSEVNHHNNNFSQITSKKDDNLRYQVQSRFDVYGINGMGFDGKQFYNWSVGGNPGGKINEEKTIKYVTKYRITKSGSLESINTRCDLEIFLLENDFKKIESKLE